MLWAFYSDAWSLRYVFVDGTQGLAICSKDARSGLNKCDGHFKSIKTIFYTFNIAVGHCQSQLYLGHSIGFVSICFFYLLWVLQGVPKQKVKMKTPNGRAFG